MKLVLDTNLLFSACVKKDGIIAEIILNSFTDIEFIGCYFSYIELFKHKNKLLGLSRLDEVELLDIIYKVFKRVNFVNEEQITDSLMNDAFSLTHDVDEKDTIFIAMSMYCNCKLWTRDKPLINGLRKKGFTEIITTSELIEIIKDR